MQVSIRKFNETDIENKIAWINDPRNNRFLHYDLPLEYEKTLNWYIKNKDDPNRFDGIVEVEGTAVGLIGLLNIDRLNCCAEFYITLGKQECKGKGIARNATVKMLKKAFTDFCLDKVFLYTEKENEVAQKLFGKVGFEQKALLESHIIYNGRKVDRFLYEITSDQFYTVNTDTENFVEI